MKKITLFFFLVFVYLSSSSYGQIGISENFNNGISDGWTGTFAATASQACSGQSVRSSIYEFNPSAELVSPNIIGVSNATDLTLSFDYKIVDWSLATNPTAEGWGNFTVDYSIDGGANWINIATVNDDNHITSAECATMTYVVPAADLPVNSDFQLRIDATWESGDYYLYFDNISALQVAEDVPDCDAVLTSPEDGAVNIPIEDSEISWSVATGIPTAYSLSVGTTPGGVDVLNNQNVGNVTSYDIGGVLEYETTYYVTIVPENEFGQALGCAEYTFTTEVDMTIPVDCNAGPVNTTFCYGEEDFEYIYQASDDNVVLNLDINSGQVEVFYDSVTVLDSDGSVIYEGDGDVAGMSFQSTGSSITLQVEGDNYNSCADGAYNPFDVSVSCSSCINPQASYAVVGDCENGSQFNVEVELTSLGDAVDVIIEDNQGESQLADVTGVYTFGPYSNGTLVDFAITSNQDPSCEITSSPITQEYCPVNYLECGVDPVNTVICYEDYEVVEVSYVTDDGSNMNLTVNSGDIYTFGGTFDVLDTNGDVLYSGYGNEGDLSGLEFQSTGDTITVVYTAGFYACEDIYTAIDITVECSTCLNPNLSYDVVSACENEVEQFFVEVTVNSLGSATSLTLTNNQDAAQENINEPTTFNFGPYPNGTEVVYTTVNDQDASCTVVSPVQTIDYCPQPPIIIDETKSVEELVDILINNPCSTVSNVTSSTGIDFGSVNGISYFDHNDSNFPLENGIVLSSGDVNDLPGPVGIGGVNTGWPGDPDLDNIISEIEGGLTDFNGANDASIIEFDFVPFVEEISFDFLFASDEYGIFQCDYSDPFGFFLTDSNGDTVNIAIVPGTTDPIAVTTVRDNTHNAGCASVNPSYFDVFYGTTGMNPLASPVNMLGRTVVMTASAQVTPGEQYHIKLAVGDRADSSYNSSTFLAAGSFELGEFTLGEDITIDDGTADTCSGDAITLDVGLENTNGADITWYQDGNLVEDANGDPVNTPTLEVTEDGEYAVSVIYFGSSCALSDVINVEFLPNPEVDLGEDIITICEGGATVIDGTPTNLSELDDVTYAWYLDGNEIAGETNATINVTEAGEYTVEVTGYQCTVSDSVVVEQVNYQVDFSNVSIGCTEEGDTNSFVLEPNIIGVLADEMNDLTYTWAPGGEQTSSITITEDGQYTVTVSYLGCFETATYNAEFTEAPQIDLGADAIV
ncbi:choice-of-anchor L domain-containing protein, partial [Mesonia mobilis]|uniref:choice-of-anchor L domain-containing protein n=1 Tax=Mesonia mobilis TaxID=369791 RepID=UPI0026F06258